MLQCLPHKKTDYLHSYVKKVTRTEQVRARLPSRLSCRAGCELRPQSKACGLAAPAHARPCLTSQRSLLRFLGGPEMLRRVLASTDVYRSFF